jgi:hypothetical protein
VSYQYRQPVVQVISAALKETVPLAVLATVAQILPPQWLIQAELAGQCLAKTIIHNAVGAPACCAGD